MNESWDLKYRPVVFEDVLGQDVTKRVLQTRLKDGSAMNQSYIFSGPRGSGKTTLARILSRATICKDIQPDGSPCNQCSYCLSFLEGKSPYYEERDAASRGTLEDVRAIISTLDYVSDRPKLVVFDESHRMSKESQDALLKPIEERRLVCIFCTTEPSKIQPTIRSRCDDFPVQIVLENDIIKRLQRICEAEGISVEEEALRLIVQESGSHVRDCFKKAEMVSRIGDITVALVREYLHLDVSSLAYELLVCLSDDSVVEVVGLLRKMLEKTTPDDVMKRLGQAAIMSYRLGFDFGEDVSSHDKDAAQHAFTVLGPRLLTIAAYVANRYGRFPKEVVEGHLLYLGHVLHHGNPVAQASSLQTPKTESASSEETPSESLQVTRSDRMAALEAKAVNRKPLTPRKVERRIPDGIIPIDPPRSCDKKLLSTGEFTSVFDRILEEKVHVRPNLGDS